MRLAFTAHMTKLPQSVRDAAALVRRRMNRLTAVIIGFITMVIGLGLAVTVVLFPAGVTLGLLGVAIIVTALFAPAGWIGD
jgi:hypothetical protein